MENTEFPFQSPARFPSGCFNLAITFKCACFCTWDCVLPQETFGFPELKILAKISREKLGLFGGRMCVWRGGRERRDQISGYSQCVIPLTWSFPWFFPWLGSSIMKTKGPRMYYLREKGRQWKDVCRIKRCSYRKRGRRIWSWQMSKCRSSKKSHANWVMISCLVLLFESFKCLAILFVLVLLSNFCFILLFNICMTAAPGCFDQGLHSVRCCTKDRLR